MLKGIKYPELQRARVGNCVICGKEYRAVGDFKERVQRYCSKECFYKRRVLNKCEHCGNDIKSYYGKKYCSRKCSHDAMIGEKSSSWKDGKSLERERARRGTELKKWRAIVFERDNYKCIKCGEVNYLHAHHIVEWSKNENKRFDVDNGQTLCAACHSLVHGRWIGRKTHPMYVIVARMIKLDGTLKIKRNGELLSKEELAAFTKNTEA